jgi:hypothetical protein
MKSKNHPSLESFTPFRRNKPIDEEVSISEHCWLAVQAIQMESTAIIIHNSLRRRQPSRGENDKRQSRRLRLVHDAKPVANGMLAQIHDNAGRENRVAAFVFCAQISVQFFLYAIHRVPLESTHWGPLRKERCSVLRCNVSVSIWRSVEVGECCVVYVKQLLVQGQHLRRQQSFGKTDVLQRLSPYW